MELPVVNHKDYVAKIDDDHKFPIKKFGELAKYLIEKEVVSKFYEPDPCSIETLKEAHSEKYILDVKNKKLSEKDIKKMRKEQKKQFEEMSNDQKKRYNRYRKYRDRLFRKRNKRLRGNSN